MRRVLWNIAGILLIVALCMVLFHGPCAAFIMKLDANERLLVVAPHPDDEVLGCGGLLQRVKALGGTAGVVYLTAGDGCLSLNPFTLVNGRQIHRNLGYRRINEAVQAMGALNITKDRMVFLGFPDQGLLPLWRMQAKNPYEEFRSRLTGANRVFYTAAESRGLSYDYDSLIQSLSLVIDRFNPTIVLIPSRFDAHPDHQATNYFVKMALKNRKRSPKVYSYLVHYKSWPAKSKKQGFYEAMQLPKELPHNSYELWLVPTEFQCKIQAIRAYRSQHPKVNRNLSSFARGEEIFWRENIGNLETPGVKAKPNQRDIEDWKSDYQTFT
ncbi:MAG TPA: PIG-L family deacetylase [Bacillota bacterium]|nr:PIG-L family deacetylase [Bacillota bacterium]